MNARLLNVFACTIALVFAAYVGGCVGSLGPIYDDADHLVFDEDLLGQWDSEGAGNLQQVTIEPYGDEHPLAEHLYRVRTTDDAGRVVSFRAGLVDVGNDRLVLDMIATDHEPDPDPSPWAILSLQAYHTLNIIERHDDGFSFRAIVPNELATHLSNDPDAVRYYHREDAQAPEQTSPLLIDEPAAMRAFLAELPEDVLSDPIRFERVE